MIFHIDPVCRLIQRSTGLAWTVVIQFRQDQRQILIIQYADSTVFIMNDRNRFAPVTLSGENPFSEFVVDLLAADASCFQPFQHGIDRIFLIQSVHKTGIDVDAVLCPGFLGNIAAFQYRNDIDTEFLCEIVVSFIMGRNRHDRTGTISHQNVVGDPDRDLLFVDRIDRISADEHTGLILIQFRPLHFGLGRTFLLIGFNFRLLIGSRDLVDQRMFRRKDAIGCTKQGIAAGRKDSEVFICSVDLEFDFRTDGLADPVALYFFCRFRPVDGIKIGQQFFRISRDVDDPLLHVLADDRITASFRLAVNDFIIGQDAAQFFTPVDRHLDTSCITVQEELFEDPLRPLVVIRIGSGNNL